MIIQDEKIKKILSQNENIKPPLWYYSIWAIDNTWYKVEIEFEWNKIITNRTILNNINKLIIPNQNIDDISRIKNFPNLILLDVKNNNIKDFSVLSSLKNLNTLNLSWLWLKKIPDSVYQLKELKQLSLNNNDIETLHFDKDIPSLLFLHLENNKIENIDKTIKYFNNRLFELYLKGNEKLWNLNFNFDLMNKKHSIFKWINNNTIIISKWDRITKLKIQLF